MFKEVLTELWKIRHGEMTMDTCEKLDETEPYKSAMMCWESLDASEPTSKKRKTLSQEEAANNQADAIDDKPHTTRTANTGIGSLIPVNDLQLGAVDDTLTLATQETLAKNLVYLTNIPDGKVDRMKTMRESSKNSVKLSSLLANPNQITSKVESNAYSETESDGKKRRAKNAK